MVINRNTIIKNLLEAHPETIDVFRKYNLVIAGGVRGPNEPIAFFAKAHEVDYDILFKELNEAIEKGKGGSAELPVFEEDKVYEKFVKTAIVLTLSAGVAVGALILSYISLKLDFSSIYYAFIQAHGHAQLFGWAGLSIMGFALYIIPRVKNAELRNKNLVNYCYGFIVTGILLRITVQSFSVDAIRFLLPLSALFELVSVFLFSLIILKTVFSSKEKTAVFDKFFKAGILWFLVTAGINLGMTVYAYSYSLHEIPKTFFSPFVHLFLFGFVFMFIFGVNIRTVYAFLDIKPVRERAVNLTFWIMNISVPVYFIAHVLADKSAVALQLSRFIVFPLAIAVISFIYGLRVFEKPTGELQDIVMDRSYTKTIRTAYLWLIAGSVILMVIPFLEVGSEVAKRFHGSLNHAITVGFVTMMIIGYASKMIPTFRGVNMYSIPLSNMTFVLLNTGCFLRVFSQMVVGAGGGNRVSYSVLGLSGWFELTALVLFGYNLWKTINIKEQLKQPEEHLVKITKDTKVFDVVNQYPETLPIFLEFGFDQIANPALLKTMGRVATIDMATKMHHVDLDNFLKSLNKKVTAV